MTTGMRQERPTQPPPNQSRPASTDEQPAPPDAKDGADPDTRVTFLSWDSPLVPEPR